MNKEFRELAYHAAHRTAPSEFSVENVDKAFAEELRKYCGSVNQFMKNRYDLFEIIIENVDDIVPNRIVEAMSIFAEVKTVGQGQKALFRTGLNASKRRAKKFLTRVGLSGVYETFRLDTTTYEVPAFAVGGAGTIDFERMLDGAESLADVMEVLTEGLEETVYKEVANALAGAVDTLNAASAHNVVVANAFDATDMQTLCNYAKSFGNGSAVIFATPEFLAEMGPDAIVPVGTNYAGVYAPDDIDSIHRDGHIKLFRGTPVIEMPQSYDLDGTPMIEDVVAYVLPAGKSKIVKVVFEGATQMYDLVNADNSIEINCYKKVGVAVESLDSFCAFKIATE